MQKTLRITRLHLILAFIGILCMAYGLFNRNKLPQWPERSMKPQQAVPPAPKVPVSPKPNLQKNEDEALDRIRELTVRSLANVGEVYRPLRQQFGDIPPISRPLRSAKLQLAQGNYEEAFRLTRESWQAVKQFKTRVTSIPGVYQVVRGDTLWQIAAAHSPVKQGPGWVTIWKANKSSVPNFNRIEVGTQLKIPQKRSDYNMPYWHPRPLQ